MNTIRNPRWGRDKGWIDCEVLLGDGTWAAYTAREADADPLSRVVFDAAKKMRPKAWVEPPPPEATPAHIKAEAARRILAICPAWRQRNLTAQAAILAAKGRDAWTAEDHEAWAEGERLWERITAIRSASDRIEALDPIPQDYRAAKHWPE